MFVSDDRNQSVSTGPDTSKSVLRHIALNVSSNAISKVIEMKILEFGSAPLAVAKGYSMTQVLKSTTDDLTKAHSSEDLIFVCGGKVGQSNDGVFEFARFEPAKPKSVTLFNQNDGADKVYQVMLRIRDGGWVVDFANGRRGKALKPGTKTETPTIYSAALEIYEKLVKSKVKGGYTTDSSGVAYTNTELANSASGISPRLPTAIEESQVATLVEDYRWLAQEKMDGENRTIQIQDGTVRGINRKGLYVDIPQSWVENFAPIGQAVIAGEHIGDLFYAFDVLEIAGCDLRKRPWQYRYGALSRLIDTPGPHIHSMRKVQAYSLSEAKAELLARVKKQNGEGVVFHEADAPFESGRSLTARKFKFVESASCVVVRKNVQRSVEIGLYDEKGSLVELGNVTVPENHAVPEVGQVCEVRYLYRFEGGCFEQPVYLGPRSDINASEALLSQIKRIKPKSLVDSVLV